MKTLFFLLLCLVSSINQIYGQDHTITRQGNDDDNHWGEVHYISPQEDGTLPSFPSFVILGNDDEWGDGLDANGGVYYNISGLPSADMEDYDDLDLKIQYQLTDRFRTGESDNHSTISITYYHPDGSYDSQSYTETSEHLLNTRHVLSENSGNWLRSGAGGTGKVEVEFNSADEVAIDWIKIEYTLKPELELVSETVPSTVPASGGNYSVTLRNSGGGNLNCSYAGEPNWVDISPSSANLSENESQTFTIDIDPNNSESSRSAQITFDNGNLQSDAGDVIITFGQSGVSPPDLRLSNSSVPSYIPRSGGSYTVRVNNDGEQTLYWDTQNIPEWVTLSPEGGNISGDGDRNVSITVEEYTDPTPDPRTATIRFYNTQNASDDADLLIRQSAPDLPDLDISGFAANWQVSAEGETENGEVENEGDLPLEWRSIVSDPDWISVSPSGTNTTAGNDETTVYISIDPNPGPGSRIGTVEFENVANPNNDETITINQEAPTGCLVGVIESQSGNPVQGVRVYTLPGNSEDISDSQGEFEICGLEYSTYDVHFELENHSFDPNPEEDVTVDQPTVNIGQIIDISAFTLSGSITYETGECQLAGVDLYNTANGDVDLHVDSEDDGNWSYSFGYGEEVVIEPRHEGFAFEPESFPLSGVHTIIEDIDNINFVCTTTHFLTVNVTGGCNEPIAGAQVTVESGSCFSETFTTNEEGNILETLSPLNYSISVTDPQNPTWFLGEVQEVNLEENSVLNFNHTTPLHVEIQNISDYEYCEGEYSMHRGIENPLSLIVKNDEGCVIEDATIIVEDRLGDVTSLDTLILEDGVGYYVAIGGLPNFGNPPTYSKLLILKVEGQGLGIDENEIREYSFVVTGAGTAENEFVTAIPNIPIRILHDPPGDMSSSYYEETYSFQQGVNMSVLSELGTEITWKASLGFGPFFSAGMEGSVNASWTTNEEGGSYFGYEFSEGVSTSSQQQNPNTIGPGYGDRFFGHGLNVYYAIVPYLTIEECNINLSEEMIWGPSDVETMYFYSEQYIRERIIAQCEDLDDPELDSLTLNNDCYELWSDILSLNVGSDNLVTDDEESRVEYLYNFSFNGDGANYSYEESVTSGATATYTVLTEVSASVAATMGFEAFGTGASGGVLVRTSITLGTETSSDESFTSTTGFTLSDDDVSDNLSVDVYKDLVFGTPLTLLSAGHTSCPWEWYSEPTIQFALNDDEEPIRNEVNSTEVVPFILPLCNTGDYSDATDEFIISAPLDLNPSHAEVTIPNPNDIGVPIGTCENIPVEISYGPNTIGDYSRVGIVAKSSCSDGQQDTSWVEIYWEFLAEVPAFAEPYPIAEGESVDWAAVDSLVFWAKIPLNSTTSNLYFKRRPINFVNFTSFAGPITEPVYSDAEWEYFRASWAIPNEDQDWEFIITNMADDGSWANSEHYSPVNVVDIDGEPYGSIAQKPKESRLFPAFPNPFNPSTTIRYGLPEDSNVSLVIYDLRGNVVQTLESEHQSAGWYDVTWNGENADGHTISTGIYFARLVAGEYSKVIKMLYLK